MMSKKKDVIWCLLKQNISTGQLLGYTIANVVGLSVILVGILFYADSRHSTDNDDNYFSNAYIVLSKKVSGIGFSPVSFSEEEIADLNKQSWTKRVGRFTSSQFAVNGAVSVGGRALSSYLFFESIPDDFFEHKPKDWVFTPEKPFVPIMLSRDYLALYNFGFAAPQGLPQVDEDVVGAIPIRLCLIGENSIPDYFDAAIVGFSSRLNTIAVPQSFMDWANARYSSNGSANSSRLIVEIDRLASSGMKDYFTEHGIEMAGDDKSTSNISSFLSIVSVFVASNGFIISSLALFILLLSIFLLLQKNKEKLRNLMLLGYSPKEVGKYYIRFVTVLNGLIVSFCIIITIIVRTTWQAQLQELSLGGASLLPIFITALSFFIIVLTINIHVIKTHLMKIWNNA